MAINLRRHRDMLCHCYGSLGRERLSTRSLLQLALLLGAGLLVWSGGGASIRLVAGLDDGVAVLAWALTAVLAGLWLLHADEIAQLYRKGCATCRRQASIVRPDTP